MNLAASFKFLTWAKEIELNEKIKIMIIKNFFYKNTKSNYSNDISTFNYVNNIVKGLIYLINYF